ncbi:hypothetical protein PCL_09450 [Purpureocillium lilacinum]|uniref:Uncharacterized protein n=1 Tax=Purpureocillium lilacinum TaxID=33203 RepID=A0A2U3DQV3_PURLI|nr:hypothetical protein Purlil1_9868 [Purpureocillium lilacinum]PWI64636.1 hypothetical protein PCL_09450 [Purpureocillium lilacinum]
MQMPAVPCLCDSCDAAIQRSSERAQPATSQPATDGKGVEANVNVFAMGAVRGRKQQQECRYGCLGDDQTTPLWPSSFAQAASRRRLFKRPHTHLLLLARSDAAEHRHAWCGRKRNPTPSSSLLDAPAKHLWVQRPPKLVATHTRHSLPARGARQLEYERGARDNPNGWLPDLGAAPAQGD